MADDWGEDATRRAKAALITTTVPNAARVADYLYGGQSNFEADRKAARALAAIAPSVTSIPPAVLAFQRRVLHFLVTEAGITQFLDIGMGLPLVGATHEVAQSLVPECRIVYVDNDPMVLSHVRAFWRSTPQGAFAALDARLTDPAALLAGAAATLDFRQPVAVLLPSTLPFIPDTARVTAVVAELLRALVPGSYLALCHVASDLDPALAAAADEWNMTSSLPVTLRSRDEVAALTAGLELVRPGLVPVSQWRPAPDAARHEPPVPVYAVLARKPARPPMPRREG